MNEQVNRTLTWKQHVDVLWSTRSRKMDWAGLEEDIRRVLAQAGAEELSPKQALALIDELMGAYTGRGQDLPEETGGWDLPPMDAAR